MLELEGPEVCDQGNGQDDGDGNQHSFPADFWMSEHGDGKYPGAMRMCGLMLPRKKAPTFPF